MNTSCYEIHKIFNGLKEYQFPFEQNEIPKNGIYILFEKGEKINGLKRIVRVGTHTGDNRLQSRLRQHFVKENKDRSVFRKNIGRALLNADNDSFLKYWELDLTTRAIKEKYSRKEKVKSVNLYQLFSYLLNQRSEDPRSWHTTGMLIYPTTTTQELNLAWQYQQHPIHIRTINLNMHWKNIEERLKAIVTEP